MVERKIEDSYNSITAKLKSHSVNEESFIKIKNNFLKEIDSPRRLSLISSLADLIDLFERRLLIYSHDIQLITKIIDLCNIEGIEKLIINHSKLLMDYNYSCGPIDYKEDNTRHEKIISDHNIPWVVIEFISNRIGDSWKEMAYELQFRAGEIDFTDENLANCVKKSQEILRKYNDRSQGCKRGRLINALSNIRRKRLRDEVEQMLMTSCINCRLPSGSY